MCDFCDKEAVYRQGHLVICSDCFGSITDLMFKNWYGWIKEGKNGKEPVMWVYNNANKIQK